MTTIILVSIGILLAAVAALFVIFYGGDAFNQGDVKAEAARLVSEGSQIESAVEIFYVQEGRLPQGVGGSSNPVSELVSEDRTVGSYLHQAPRGMADDWQIDYRNKLIRTTLGEQSDRNLAVCREARRQLERPNPDQVYKCDGSDYPGNPSRLPSLEPCCVWTDSME